MPRKKTETAANLLPSSAKTVSIKKQPGRTASHDWTEIRRQYVRGNDKVTFAHLGTQIGNPTLSAIKKRAGKEKWADLRAEFRNQVGSRMNQMDLETIEDVRLRHVNSARDLQDLAAKGLEALLLRANTLSAFEVARLMQLGLEAERKARGMEEFTVRIEDLRSPADLKKLTPEQLLELRGRLKARGQA